jgi:hypothetical protein
MESAFLKPKEFPIHNYILLHLVNFKSPLLWHYNFTT